MAAFIMGRWTAGAAAVIRPVALLCRREPPVREGRPGRDAATVRREPALVANVSLHLAWPHLMHRTATLQTVVLQPQIAAMVLTRPADLRLPMARHGVSTTTVLRHRTDNVSVLRAAREGSASGAALAGGPGHQYGSGSVETRIIALPRLLPASARSRILTRTSVPPSAGWSGGQRPLSRGHQVSRVSHLRRPGVPSPAPRVTQRGEPARTIRWLPPHAPALVIRSVGRRVLPRPSVIGSPARTVGWYRTNVERIAAPPVPMTMSERPPAGHSLAERDATRRYQAVAIEYAKPEAALARTVSDAVRGVAQVLRSETKLVTPAPPAPQVDVGRLTRQVYEQLERELRIEKERRGL